MNKHFYNSISYRPWSLHFSTRMSYNTYHLEDEIRYLRYKLREEMDYGAHLRETIRQRYEETERVCRVLTDIADDIRTADPELYKKVIAPIYDGDKDPRPDWFLDEEYGIRTV